MPQNNPRPPKRTWRGDRPASGRPSAGQPAWKAERGGAPGPRVSRGVKIFAALVLFLLVAVGAVVVYLWMQPPDPFRLVLVGAGYDQNLAVPSNAIGRRGLDGLGQWAKEYNEKPFGREKGKNVVVKPMAIEESNDPVGEAVADCTSKTIVVFLSADGGGDDQGAYVLPENAGPRNLDAVYRIDKALDALKNKPDAKKLLLLDASSNGPDWAMRQLHNDFVRSVKKLEPRIKEIPNLVVLCACDEGQQSWASEEYGQTIFAHFVTEGLKGAADKKWDDDEDLAGCNVGDGRISALELARYVQFQVERWTRRNRDAEQKPLLLGGDKRAADLELGGADGDYKEPDPANLTAWSPPDELLQAWKDHDDLTKGSPPPAAYTPIQWREYEAALLRYEQLLRTDPGGTSAGALRQRIGTLHDKIAQDRRLDRDSMAVSLAAPAAFGWSPPPDAFVELETHFNQLWRDTAATPDKFKGLLAYTPKLADVPNQTAERLAQRLTRLRLIGLLLDKAPAASPNDYQRVCEVLPIVAESPAPAEANFAVMARESEKHLPGGAVASWDRLKLALALRRLAEAAALGLNTKADDLPAYSEQTKPWIWSVVEPADGNRRLGEDLLFAAAEDATAQANLNNEVKADLDNAAAVYNDVAEHALAVRRAIQARDQALAELPWYTQWLGRRLLGDEEKKLTDLWVKVHELCDQLDTPDYAKASKDSPLTAATDTVNAGLLSLREQFRGKCGDKNTQWKERQGELRTLEDLLSIPLIDPDVRMNLLRNEARISLALNTATKGAAAETEAPPAADSKALAFQQGRLAVAVLGLNNADGKRATDLLQRIDELAWQPDLDTAGEEIGRGFQNLARNAAVAADKARRAPTADAAVPLRQAALAARFLDAGEADAWLAAVDPAAENRWLQLHDLLVWQAERAYKDYWVSTDAANPNYYHAVGIVCTRDARDLVTEAAAAAANLKDEEKEARLTEVKRVEDLLKPSADFSFRRLDSRGKPDPDDVIHITDAYKVQFQYGLMGPKDAPAGRPVVWAVPGPKLIAAQDAGRPQPLNHAPDRPGDDTAPPYPLPPYDVSPVRPGEGPPPDDPQMIPPARYPTDFAVKGAFRGRFPTLDTQVILHNRPDVVSYQPREGKKALIAVQATRDDFNAFAAKNSELVVVVDCSRSMIQNKVPPSDDSRFTKALEALGKCLQKLPPGVKLTVMTFSAKKDSDPTNYGDIKFLQKSKAWSHDQQPDLMAQLQAMTPWGYTPLVRSIGEAAETLKNSNVPAKTILVLTDGGDNELARGQEVKQREKAMKEFLHDKFEGKGIRVNVVGFRLDDLLNKKRVDRSDEENDEVDGYTAFVPAIKDVDGTIEDAEDADTLAAKLEAHFLQIPWRIEYDNRDPVLVDAVTRKGLQVSATDTNIRPSIPVDAPADYYVLIEAARGANQAGHDLPDQHIHVEPGEVLVLDMKSTSDPKRPFELRRDIYARSTELTRSKPAMKPLPVGNDWLLTVLGDYPTSDKALMKVTRFGRDLTLSEENTDDHVPVGGTVQQVRPKLAWFNVLPPQGGTEPECNLRFYPLPGYPAPVWRLNLDPKKPSTAPAAPLVDAWWCEHDLPQKAVTVLAQGEGKDYMVPSDLNGRPIDVRPLPDDPAPSSLVVESVELELPRSVQDTPGHWTDMDCLVVRLRYPPGKPYIVELPDDLMKTAAGQQAGHEHRIYTEANKYTGIFYGVGKDKLQKLTSLNLISLEGVKLKAVNREHPLAILGPGGLPPDPRPLPPDPNP